MKILYHKNDKKISSAVSSASPFKTLCSKQCGPRAVSSGPTVFAKMLK